MVNWWKTTKNGIVSFHGGQAGDTSTKENKSCFVSVPDKAHLQWTLVLQVSPDPLQVSASSARLLAPQFKIRSAIPTYWTMRKFLRAVVK